MGQGGFLVTVQRGVFGRESSVFRHPCPKSGDIRVLFGSPNQEQSPIDIRCLRADAPRFDSEEEVERGAIHDLRGAGASREDEGVTLSDREIDEWRLGESNELSTHV